MSEFISLLMRYPHLLVGNLVGGRDGEVDGGKVEGGTVGKREGKVEGKREGARLGNAEGVCIFSDFAVDARKE